MKTTKTLTIKNTILATFAVAGLVAGTAACGGKNTDSADAEKQALVELLLAAAQSGDAGEIADAIAEADPDLVAQIVPELSGDLDFTMPEAGGSDADAPVAPEAADVTPEEESTPEEVAPEAEEAAPEVVTPEEESTPEEVAPEDESTPEEVAPEEEAAPEGDDGEFDFDFDFDIDVPVVTMPTLTITPEIDGAMVFADGAKYRVTIFVEENSTLLLADIETVTVRYLNSASPIPFPVTKQASLGSSFDDSSIWTLSGLAVNEGDTLTITATNRMGQSDTMQVVVSPVMPL